MREGSNAEGLAEERHHFGLLRRLHYRHLSPLRVAARGHASSRGGLVVIVFGGTCKRREASRRRPAPTQVTWVPGERRRRRRRRSRSRRNNLVLAHEVPIFFKGPPPR